MIVERIFAMVQGLALAKAFHALQLLVEHSVDPRCPLLRAAADLALTT
jgi:hypothetical protein